MQKTVQVTHFSFSHKNSENSFDLLIWKYQRIQSSIFEYLEKIPYIAFSIKKAKLNNTDISKMFWCLFKGKASMSGVQFCSSYTHPAIMYCAFFSIFSLLCKCISLQLQQVIFHTFEKKKTYLKDIDKSWCCNNAFKLQQQCYRYIFMMGQCYDFGETFPLRNFSVRLGQVKTQKNGYVTLLECFSEAPARSAIKEVFYQATVFLFTKYTLLL